MKMKKLKISLVKAKNIVKVLCQPLIKLVGNLKDKNTKIIHSHSK